MKKSYPIGVFDSGYGGLTVLSELFKELPEYDFYYLGDNARSPYGTRSFETVYTYTLQAVKKLFDMGCQLVILACNTASAKALRTIQQNDLPNIAPNRRVLGVIRPSVEVVNHFTQTQHVGIFISTAKMLHPMHLGNPLFKDSVLASIHIVCIPGSHMHAARDAQQETQQVWTAVSSTHHGRGWMPLNILPRNSVATAIEYYS